MPTVTQHDNHIFKLEYDDNDLTAKERGTVDGDRTLGRFDDLKKIIINKVLNNTEEMVPDQYSIDEVSLKIALGGSLAGVSLDGSITLKLKPVT